MTSIANDPEIQLAFSVFESKGVFAVFIGSGLSRAAEIPTGWEITLDLIRRVGLAQGIEEQSDWAAWYRTRTGNEPNYSTLLEELAASPEERRSILHSYIEPTESEREEGRKIPTTAHRTIAELVSRGYIRVIVTTNFDRLMENALRERGIEPTIVASVDALLGAEPITHSACYILKLHGDYKDARILNTDVELSSYPAEYGKILDRIIDEHGLIVCGWSGEWDHALISAFLRAQNRRYSVFWAAKGDLGSGAKELVSHRRARVIPISDADSFFSTLKQRIEALEQSQQQNPLSVELLINNTKRLLTRSEFRIQLDELFTQETYRVLELLDNDEFSPNASWDPATFRMRVQRYEAVTEAIAGMVGVLGRWGAGQELSLVLDLINSLYIHAGKVGSGVIYHLNLRSYPAALVLTAYALGLTRAGRWKTLHDLFETKIHGNHHESRRLVEILFLHGWDGADANAWKQIEGLQQRKTPFSDHLFLLFTSWAKRFSGLTPDFELEFERFEVLGALAYLEREGTDILRMELSAKQGGRDFVWIPVGRVGWNNRDRTKLIQEIQTPTRQEELLNAGFAKGEPEFLSLFIENFQRIAARMQWP